MASTPSQLPRRQTGVPARTLSAQLVESLTQRLRAADLKPGERLPTETALMAAHAVSRTVVREAISQLQAAGLVETRHGIGTFVLDSGDAAPFRIHPRQMATLQDVVAVLELRIGVETEAAALAAQRRGKRNLTVMRAALDAFDEAVARGGDAVAPDFRFHGEIARATQNHHFADLLASLGTRIIPRARLGAGVAAGRADARAAGQADSERRSYLRQVNLEHEAIYDAVLRQDAAAAAAAMRSHLVNSRERRRRHFDPPA